MRACRTSLRIWVLSVFQEICMSANGREMNMMFLNCHQHLPANEEQAKNSKTNRRSGDNRWQLNIASNESFNIEWMNRSLQPINPRCVRSYRLFVEHLIAIELIHYLPICMFCLSRLPLHLNWPNENGDNGIRIRYEKETNRWIVFFSTLFISLKFSLLHILLSWFRQINCKDGTFGSTVLPKEQRILCRSYRHELFPI